MSRQVIIKHNKYGIELVLNNEISFDKLLEFIVETFQASANFFKDAKLLISFKGRTLSEQEMIKIIDTIMENSSIRIIGIMDKDLELEAAMEAHLFAEKQKYMEAQIKKETIFKRDIQMKEPENQSIISDFYIGNVRSGQVLECVSSITVVGDVNPGAKIISEGNIVVLGALKGNAHAGVSGNNNCFIFALDMSPIQLQVGEYFAKSPDKEIGKKKFKKKTKAAEGYHPKIALAREGNIYIEPMKKGCLGNL